MLQNCITYYYYHRFLDLKMRAVFLVAFVLLAFATATIMGDCLSGRYKGPCAVWDNDSCRRTCKENEGRISGHCSPSLKCWCEGC